MFQQLSEEQQRRIDDLIGGGRLIEAIKRYREATGQGLKEAKDAIESRAAVLRSGGDATGLSSAILPGGQAGGVVGPTGEQWQQIDEQCLAGRKIEAIRLYRTFTGVGLKEAKDAVELHIGELQRRFPGKFPVRGKGCLGMLVCLAAGIAVLAVTLGYAVVRMRG